MTGVADVTRCGKRLLKLGLVVGLGALLLAGGGLALWLRSGLPAYSGTVLLAGSAPGLTASVTIARDAEAVPHIFAENANDGYFALGFVHAQDRLWQMDMMRRAGAGRLSELFGDRDQSRYLKLDRFMRTLGLYRLAEASFAIQPPEVQTALVAYSAGVNAYLTRHKGAWPPEFLVLGYLPEPWRPADSLVWGKLMALQLSSNFRGELLRTRMLQRLTPWQVQDLYPGYPADMPLTLAGLETNAQTKLAELADTLNTLLPAPLGPETASNEAVLAGSRTASGKPLLANDPHLALSLPIVWYLARIETPDLQLAGATTPGVPFHILGHNGHIAWGSTSTGSDVQDLFVEQLAPEETGFAERVVTPWGTEPFTVRIENIRVRNRSDEVLTVRTTRHGPVLSDSDPGAAEILGSRDHVLALAFTTLTTDDTTPEALWRLNRARSWEGFTQALRLMVGPPQNIAYADIDGNIGFVAAGHVPVRRTGDGRLPVPGWTEQYDWTGFIPFEELPQRLNPPEGLIFNANNAVVGKDYPYHLTYDWEDHYRAQRLGALLTNAPPQSPDSLETILLDTLSLPVADLLPQLQRASARTPTAAAALARLKNWDGRMDRSRTEPLLFWSWLTAIHRALFADELGTMINDFRPLRPEIIRRVLAEDLPWCDNIDTPTEERCTDLLTTTLEQTLARLEQRHGPHMDDWLWGRAHRATFQHPIFARIPLFGALFDYGLETDGDAHTLNRGATWSYDPNTPFQHSHGAGLRAVYDLDDLSHSRFSIATGQSGHPLSHHFADLTRRWRAGDHLILAGSRDDIAARGVGVLVLAP